MMIDVDFAADSFVGCLFTGLMITDSGPKVLEYNARLGDPETQTLLPLLDPKTDLARTMLACTRGDLLSAPIGIQPGYSATIILAAGGYPGSYQNGFPIEIDTSMGSKLNWPIS
jgi:phosphoribosylamine--glycine ligase / phosphoribosylformylglycinamidine cyclo-ligase